MSNTSNIEKQKRGWMLPYLVSLDVMPGVGSGRWAYWLDICDRLALPQERIPRIEFAPLMMGANVDNQAYTDGDGRVGAGRWVSPNPGLMKEQPDKHIKRMLDQLIYKSGRWYDDAWISFTTWLLWGFGDRSVESEVERIPAEVREFWYGEFNLAYLLSCPMDWSAWILQSGPQWMGNGRAKWAKSTGFYSTPLNICNLMVEMALAGTSEDTRILTVCDPCCGTGSMLLPASNYSLRLYGQDIVYELVQAAKLNGWLYMPWLVFHPAEVEEMFIEISNSQSLTNSQSLNGGHQAIPVAPLRLETRPEAIEATQKYRAGEITQADFFSLLS